MEIAVSFRKQSSSSHSPSPISPKERCSSIYRNIGLETGQFTIETKNYTQQYSHIYFQRLARLKPVLEERASKKWKAQRDARYVKRLLDIEAGQLSIIIGTVFLDNSLKPKILEEIAAEMNICMPIVPEHYWCDKMKVMLEDESGRLALDTSTISSNNIMLVTGIIAAFLGREADDGSFIVKDVCFPEYPPQNIIELSSESKYVLLCSGLNIGSMPAEQMGLTSKLNLLVDFLRGEFGSEADQLLVSKITRAVFCGNSTCKPIRKDVEKKKRYGENYLRFDLSPIRRLDQVLLDIASVMDIDVMPGVNDPCNTLLPQQPIIPALFNVRCYNSFNTVTNPYHFSVDGVEFYGTSGQNLDDVYRYISVIGERLDISEHMLQWRMTFPTAPDTLCCHPFFEKEPFILTSMPHVYFVGNQNKFETRTINQDGIKSLIVHVPRFDETGIAVLVNISNLTCQAVSFESSLKEIFSENLSGMQVD